MIPKVVHCKKEPYNVYCGRPSRFGNPFVIGKDGTREDVVKKYKEWIMSQPDLIKEVKSNLKGKTLACWCAPLACHCDVLLEIANEEN